MTVCALVQMDLRLVCERLTVRSERLPRQIGLLNPTKI